MQPARALGCVYFSLYVFGCFLGFVERVSMYFEYTAEDILLGAFLDLLSLYVSSMDVALGTSWGTALGTALETFLDPSLDPFLDTFLDRF